MKKNKKNTKLSNLLLDLNMKKKYFKAVFF